MWVQLACIQYIERYGRQITYFPGDWVDVGKQQALRWIANGDAHALDPSVKNEAIDYSAGIVATTTPPDDAIAKLKEIPQLQLQVGTPELAFSETMLWNPSVPLKFEMMPVGFKLLEKWQMAVPLLNYETLACHIGSEADRERAKGIIRDLRIPVRDTRLIFLRRCEATRNLITFWQKEVAGGTNDYLAFLMAIYKVKPVVCDLPTTWTV